MDLDRSLPLRLPFDTLLQQSHPNTTENLYGAIGTTERTCRARDETQEAVGQEACSEAGDARGAHIKEAGEYLRASLHCRAGWKASVTQRCEYGWKKHHGLHEVRKAAKKATMFELRKLVKRLKQARCVFEPVGVSIVHSSCRLWSAERKTRRVSL